MREILFRGKRINDGEWAKGFYAEMPYGEDAVSKIIRTKTRQHPNFSLAYPCQVFESEEFEVDPETVGQYTGLKDKNGKGIFEGDILYCYDEMFRATFTGEVVYRSASFCIKEREDDYLYHFRWDDYVCEVIGNIHDNPELLKE